MYIDDTIAAIATPPGIGGIGIIRISGFQAFAIIQKIFKSKQNKLLSDNTDRRIYYGHVYDNQTSQLVDEAIVLFMKGPRSYTAEDVVEIQCHGGFVSVRKILELVLHEGVRLAEPGEFTRRAFLNGRIDLVEAEAVIDIIEAKTERSLSLAVDQLNGGLTNIIEPLRDRILALIAKAEVTIDYPEEDIEKMTAEAVGEELVEISKKLDDLLATAKTGKMIRDGVSVVIAGRPNAGKSSLLNAVIRENRAIVTDIPGTTRDSIEEYVTIEGIPIKLIDTAGIRDTEDTVEKIGVEKAKSYIDISDIVLYLIDGTTILSDEDKNLLKKLSGKHCMVCINKADIVRNARLKEEIKSRGSFYGVEFISAAEGVCPKAISDMIKHTVYEGSVVPSNTVMLSNIRHISLVKSSLQDIDQALHMIKERMPIDMVVTDIRSAWERLGEITGKTVREELTDELFSRFCLGK